MKIILASLIFCFTIISNIAVAQGSQVQQEESTAKLEVKPEVLLYDGKHYFQLSSIQVKELNPDWVESVTVIKKEDEKTVNEGAGSEGRIVILSLNKESREANSYIKSVRNQRVKAPIPAGVIID